MKTPAQKAADKRANSLLLSGVKRTKPHRVRHIVITPANPIAFPVWSKS